MTGDQALYAAKAVDVRLFGSQIPTPIQGNSLDMGEMENTVVEVAV